jgi:predicted RNase H-like nuclease
MSLVLGIDAAWTAKNPSGIALVSTETDPPKLIRASPSFEDFMLGTKPDAWCGKHEPQASLSEVLSKAAEIAGGAVTVIAVDMPVAMIRFGSGGNATTQFPENSGDTNGNSHPYRTAPSKVSIDFMRDAAAGFTLRTCSSRTNGGPSVLEAYPHVALLKLFQEDDGQLPERLRYKLSRRKAYWPTLSPEEGREEIKREWERILARLKSKIDLDLEIACAGRKLRCWKAWEDVIDAIVCCWVGLQWLAGRAKPYGDAEAAIWVPNGIERKAHDVA